MRRVCCVVGAVIGLLCVFSPSASAAVKHAPPPRPAQQHFRTHAVPGTPGPSAADSTIAWGPCTEQDLIDLGAQCGYLPVPVNYRHPNGPQIQLAVSRLEHTSSDADYKGVILTNPGGRAGPGWI